jgi:hypothetical protein
MQLEFYQNFPNNSRWWMNPTIIEAPIKTESINTRRPSAPMKRVELGTKFVLITRKYFTSVRTPSMVEHVEELMRD